MTLPNSEKNEPKPTSKRNAGKSRTQIQRLLREAVFNPREPGVMKIVAQTENSNYFELRAIECVHEARALMIGSPNPAEYKKQLITAIRLLTLAITEECA